MRRRIKSMLRAMSKWYDLEALEEIFEGIKKIVEHASLSDLERIGKFFLELRKDPSLIDDVMKEYEEWGL
jgi:hypothetical protein